MKTLRIACALAVFAGVWSSGSSSRAAFHFWVIEEIFSNHDGTVQFVELFTAAPGETALNFHTLEATSDGVLKTFTLDHNVSFPTTNKHLLFATAGFGSLTGGVAPDYVPLPANFFNPNAASITISWAHGTDVATFAGSLLPKDGVNSLIDSNLAPSGPDVFSVGVNTPTNFAGASGSVNLPPPGGNPADFNGDLVVDAADYVVWRKTDGTQNGYNLWRTNFGRTSGSGSTLGASSSVPEPGTAALLMLCTLGVVRLRCARPR